MTTPMNQTPIKTPLEILTEAGFEAYLVGGCVRDHLLGRVPKDVDIATSALPTDVLHLFPGSKYVGEAFGVVLVQTPMGPVEIATFRGDGIYTDSRHPDTVEFKLDVREDAARRDFTINALYMDKHGIISDFHTGRADLAENMIQCVGTPITRFEEDPLRMLRALRFACQLNMDIGDRMYSGFFKCRHLLTKVSAERIGDEIVKMFRYNGSEALAYLKIYDLLEALLPEIHQMRHVIQDTKYHPEGDVYAHTYYVLWWLTRLPFEMRDEVTVLAALLHDIAKPKTQTIHPEIKRIKFIGHEHVGVEMARAVVRRLRRPKEVEDAVAWIVENHLKPGRASEYRPAKLKRLLSHPYAPQLLRVAWADSMGGYRGDIANLRICRDIMREVANPVVDLKPKRLINGHDLMSEFGIDPGPLVGRILRIVEDAELDGTIKTREEALNMAALVMRNGEGWFYSDEE